MKLVLVRHGQSEWNELNLFTGWTDVVLSEKGIEEAKDCGKTLLEFGYDFDICYTSYLKRAIDTLNIILMEMDRQWLPIIKSYKLNERHYGALQGLNKKETAEIYGEEQVQLWRRSFSVLPPKLNIDDERNPIFNPAYRNINPKNLPLAESLETTIKRVVPYFEDNIKKDMISGKRVIIAAHGNSIRALVKYFEKLSDDEIVDVNIPTGIPLVYEFDDNFNIISKEFLGNKDLIKDKINNVKNQTNLK